jgi:hypothetical protein
MAYQIDKTNGTLAAVVEDNSTATVADIILVGKSTRNYGEDLNENLIKLTENFSNSSPPSSTLVGQLWWSTADNKLLVKYAAADLSTSWKPVNTPTISPTEPPSPAQGDLWYDSSLIKLKLWTGASWLVIGPEDSSGGINGVFADTLGSPAVPILKILINSGLVGIISNNTITPSDPIANFPATIPPGLTLRADHQINTGKLVINNSGVIPKTNNDIDLGSSTLKFSNVHSTTFTGQATSAATVSTTSDNTATDRYVTFVDSDTNSDQAVYTNSGLTYNPDSDVLTVSGRVAGNQLESTVTDNDVAPIIVASNKKVNNLQAATAAKWHAPITLSVSNHISGSANIDGSAAVDISATLTAAAFNALLPPGIILMWSGSTTEIPNGWALCDGTDTTPDLRGRFIVGVNVDGVGAGRNTGRKEYALGNSGGSENAVIVEHSHTGTATSGNATHSHSATSTVTDNGHSHGLPTDVIGSGDFQTLVNTANADEDPGTSPDAKRTATSTTGITVSTAITEANAAHSHTLSIDNFGELGTDKRLPPYYALCYIMKVTAT